MNKDISLEIENSEFKDKSVKSLRTFALISFINLGSFLFSFTILKLFLVPYFNSLQLVCLMILMTFVFMLLSSFVFEKSHRRNSNGLDFKNFNSSFTRVMIKFLGLLLGLGFLGLMYWVFPFYHKDANFHDYFQILREVLPWFLVFSVPYIYWIDGYMVNPYDGYWQVGLICLGRFKNLRNIQVHQFFFGWLVKGFFLPLMMNYMIIGCGAILNQSLSDLKNFSDVFEFIYKLLYFVDVLFAVIGYLASLRITDSHIRSVEPSLMGWVVALICYSPFMDMLSLNYISYSNPDLLWGAWLFGNYALYVVWGVVILSLVFIYTWSTISFGLRFSNLTNRGIVTTGPYAWTKHPAYLAKSLSYWMISVPFVATDSLAQALRRCLCLLVFNLIYFLRAKTEEAHLSQDLEYLNYARAIQENGVFTRSRHFIFKIIRLVRVSLRRHSLLSE